MACLPRAQLLMVMLCWPEAAQPQVPARSVGHWVLGVRCRFLTQGPFTFTRHNILWLNCSAVQQQTLLNYDCKVTQRSSRLQQ